MSNSLKESQKSYSKTSPEVVEVHKASTQARHLPK